MNRHNLHGPECNCAECILGEGESIVDLYSTIKTDEIYALNEKNEGQCKKVVKPKDKMLDKTDFTESNDGDPDFIIYIPFTEQVKVRSLIMIGGEDGTSPARIKLFVNNDTPDFDLADAPATQVIDCVENPEGELKYTLAPAKFNSVWSITMLVMLNHLGDNTKIYYIEFDGISTNKRRKVMLGTYEIMPLPEKVKKVEESRMNANSIYG